MAASDGEHPARERVNRSILSAKHDDAALGEALEAFRLDLLKAAGKGLGPQRRGGLGASDVVQETFAIARRKVGDFRGTTVGEWRGWLHRILRSRLGKARRIPSPPPGISWLDQVTAPVDSPSAVARRVELLAALEAAIGRLPEHYRVVVRCRVEERLSYRAIAERLGHGATDEAVRGLWTRAVKRLNHDMVAFE
jgi:RNA polymerase sigma factor (sigma-70 family)